MNPSREWLFLIFGWFLYVNISNGFNIDKDIYTVHHGPKNTMFGYSVALHIANNQSWAIVGAPAGNLPKNRNRTEGAVYRCNVDEPTCERIDVNVNHISRKRSKSYKTTDSWFGARVESLGKEKPIVICAPRFVHRRSALEIPIGSCILLNHLNSSELTVMNPCETSPKREPAVEDQYCQAGFSTTFSREKDREYLYIGSPSHYAYPRSSYIHPIDLKTYRERTGMRTTVIDNTLSSYFQYSIAALKFGLHGVLAASLPRGATYLGEVIIFDAAGGVVKRIFGAQLGAYFGYALCSVDVNGDSNDDLIVSAPMYAQMDSGTFDTGRIYVFIQNRQKSDFFKTIIIDGMKSSGRFGMSLASLGDIDLDGYEDFAVGAPYDGVNNRGAIYIYRGAAVGPSLKYSQVIYAEDFPEPYPSTFGFSLASGVDADGNGYPDLIVGAYESDTVVILKARPVILINASVSFEINPKIISLDERVCKENGTEVACVTLNSCFSFTGERLPLEIDIVGVLTLDGEMKGEKRMFFSGSKDYSRTFTKHLVFRKRSCISYSIYINPQLVDKLSPLMAEMVYQLQEDRDKGMKKSTITPMVNPESEQTIRDEMRIMTNCGSDEVCVPDLQLTLSTEDSHTLGFSDRVKVNVSVSNQGEDAYESRFFMTFKNKLYFRKIESTSSSAVTCSTVSRGDDTTIKCDIGNPLLAKKFVNFNIIFTPSGIFDNVPEYRFYCEVNSTNTEDMATKSDNIIVKSIKIEVKASLTIIGNVHDNDILYDVSEFLPTQFAKQESELGPEVIQRYNFRNEGPAPILKANVYIVWPYKTFAGDYVLYLLDPPTSTENVQCSKVEYNELNINVKQRLFHQEFGTTLNISFSEDLGATIVPENKQLEELLSCENFYCMVLNCTINSLERNEDAFLIIRSRLVAYTVNRLVPRFPAMLSNRVAAIITKRPYFESPADPVYSYEIQYMVTPVREVKIHLVPLWIIVISSAFGSLIFLALVYSLCKCGFFERKKIPISDEVNLIKEED